MSTDDSNDFGDAAFAIDVTVAGLIERGLDRIAIVDALADVLVQLTVDSGLGADWALKAVDDAIDEKGADAPVDVEDLMPVEGEGEGSSGSKPN